MSNLTTLVLAGLLVYAGACVFWPLAPCGRCKGSGRLPSWWDGSHARKCPRCKGNSWRTRWGLRAFRAVLAHRARR